MSSVPSCLALRNFAHGFRKYLTYLRIFCLCICALDGFKFLTYMEGPSVRDTLDCNGNFGWTAFRRRAFFASPKIPEQHPWMPYASIDL